MANTIDGRTRLRRRIQALASEQVVRHTTLGNAAKVYLGAVTSSFPDLHVSLQGLTQIDPTVDDLSLTQDLLIIPDDIRLARGDLLALLPCQGDTGVVKYLVIRKIRKTDTSPVDIDAKFGWNGDIVTPGGFRGIEVAVNGANEGNDSVVAIYGDQINITSIGGANVYIDGIHFKTHTHPGGGPPIS
jgi:hypothetical protein